MRLPEWLARFNRHVTNPIQRRWAGRLRPWALVEHAGRRTGRVRLTPVLAFPTARGFAVVLFYGRDRDWLRNLRERGGGWLRRRGERLPVAGVVVREDAGGRALLPRPVAAVARLLDVPAVAELRPVAPGGRAGPGGAR